MVARRGTPLVSGMIVVVLAIVAALLVSGLLSTRASGADAERCARLSAQSRAREHLVSGSGARVAVIGDSYSVGLGLRDPGQSWPHRLPGRVQVFGFSGSGFSAHSSPCPGVAYDVRARHALRGGAGLVVVEGGLNDYDQPASALRTGFRALVRELGGRKVLVVGPPDAPARAVAARRVDAILRDECARAGVPYLSMAGRHFDYLADRLHLTPAGHRAFGDVVAAAVAG